MKHRNFTCMNRNPRNKNRLINYVGKHLFMKVFLNLSAFLLDCLHYTLI